MGTQTVGAIINRPLVTKLTCHSDKRSAEESASRRLVKMIAGNTVDTASPCRSFDKPQDDS